jgi:hypothetical protein
VWQLSIEKTDKHTKEEATPASPTGSHQPAQYQKAYMCSNDAYAGATTAVDPTVPARHMPAKLTHTYMHAPQRPLHCRTECRGASLPKAHTTPSTPCACLQAHMLELSSSQPGPRTGAPHTHAAVWGLCVMPAVSNPEAVPHMQQCGGCVCIQQCPTTTSPSNTCVMSSTGTLIQLKV